MDIMRDGVDRSPYGTARRRPTSSDLPRRLAGHVRPEHRGALGPEAAAPPRRTPPTGHPLTTARTSPCAGIVGIWRPSCKSDFVPDGRQIRWVGTFSNREIARNRERDRAALSSGGDDVARGACPPAARDLVVRRRTGIRAARRRRRLPRRRLPRRCLPNAASPGGGERDVGGWLTGLLRRNLRCACQPVQVGLVRSGRRRARRSWSGLDRLGPQRRSSAL